MIRKFIQKNINIITVIPIGMWGCLGAYRGHNFYINEKIKNGNKYYYLTDFFFTLAGLGIYSMPLFIPAALIYELYNIEEKIRGI